jgi:hypothetical protein
VSDFGDALADFAVAHAGCAAHVDVERYLEAVAPLVDRTGPERYYYVNKPPSTCGLSASQSIAAAMVAMGLPVPDRFDESYPKDEIGTAVSNVETTAKEHGAWEAGEPTEPFKRGDVVLIDGPPYGEHVVQCVADVVVNADGSWSGRTVQGGQADGGVQAFDSTWRFEGGELYAGLSKRDVRGVMRAAKMAPDVPSAPHGGPADDTTDPHNAETLPGA